MTRWLTRTTRLFSVLRLSPPPPSSSPPSSSPSYLTSSSPLSLTYSNTLPSTTTGLPLLLIRHATHASRKKTNPNLPKLYHSPPRSIRRPPPSRKAPVAPVVYTHTKLKVAIIGRPNVGKSTLFNRLASAVRGRGNEGVANPAPLVFVRSVVDSVAGVTRDPREASGALSDLLVTVVDTPGLENAVGDSIPESFGETSMSKQKSKPSGLQLMAAGAMCDDPVYRALYSQMEEKTVKAVDEADVIFMVLDSGDGVTAVDKSIANWLHNTVQGTSKRVVVIANKCDLKDSEHKIPDAYELGFGDPLALSAEQGLGFGDLYAEMDRLNDEMREQRGVTDEVRGYNNEWKRESEGCGVEEQNIEEEEERASFDDELFVGYADRPGEEPLRQLIVSIVGRPNVGKSTLLNRLAGEERSLVGPEAGVTRDAVLCEWRVPDAWHVQGKRGTKSGTIENEKVSVWLVDTAGVRTQTKVVEEKIELLSVRSSLRALRHSHVVIMVVDAREPLVQQDTKLMDLVVAHGRAVVLVVNKMDKVEVGEQKDGFEMREWRMGLRYKVDSKLSEVPGIEIVEMSAKNWEDDPGQMKRLFDAVMRARMRWEKRVPTAQLNRFVQKFNERMRVGGGTRSTKRNRIGVTKFITQKKIRPPMFRLDGSSAVSLNYLRALTNAIRLEFGFQGVPIRVKRPTRGRR